MEQAVQKVTSSEVVFPDLYATQPEQPLELEAKNSNVKPAIDPRIRRFGEEITKQNLMLQVS